MKFFTAEWHRGEVSDEESETVWAEYREHISRLVVMRMPATVRALALGVNIHDGRFRAVALDRPHEELTLTMRCGDLQTGYFDLKLVYGKVVLDELNVSTLREAARNPDTEVLYDEIDMASNNCWLHRISFWPYREIAVGFEDLAVHLEPRQNREFSRPDDVFTEMPAIDWSSGFSTSYFVRFNHRGGTKKALHGRELQETVGGRLMGRASIRTFFRLPMRSRIMTRGARARLPGCAVRNLAPSAIHSDANGREIQGTF